MDFTKFYKSNFDPAEEFKCPHYDLFVSAFDGCDRTQIPFEKISAKEKLWMLFPQYVYGDNIPKQDVYKSNGRTETEYFQEFMKKYDRDFLCNSSICLDSTGFLRPHLIYLIAYLNFIGVKKLDVLYTEPQIYSQADDTKFSNNVESVRMIEGCTSISVNTDNTNDVLIVCSGYDEQLFAAVASDKSYCRHKYHIIGFPSLQADMYQESMLRFYNIKESIGTSSRRFAPAFDPFVTAQAIEEIIGEIQNPTNIYLSPLSTKPQTIGMALYYLYSKSEKSVNILFPFSMEYTSGHTVGVKRTWKYTIELPNR